MAGAGRRSLRDSSFSSLRLACIAALLLASAAFSSAKPSTHKRLPLEAEAFTPTGPYLTHSAADCPASAQVCLSTGLTFPLMDDKQHGFDPHPKDRPDKYSPITQAFPITITSTEAITGLQFEAVDEDCVRPWLSGMAGQENSLLLQLFWGGQIEFNAPAVFPTEPESMDELPPQKEAALFAIAGVGSAHPPEKQLCITTIRATIGEEAQILTGAPVNCPFDMMRCTPAISTKAETELIPGRLAELYKKAAKLPAEEHNAITRMQSGITELLARVHPDDALVVNQTVAKALLRQELGPFNKETAQPYTRVLLDWAANATTQAEWVASAPSKKPRAQQQAVRQAAARQAAQQVIAEEDDEDAEAESEDDYGLGFDLEQPALLDVLQQNSGQQAAPFSQQQGSRLQPGQRTQEPDEDVSAGYGDQDPEPIDETSYLHPFSLDISRRRLLQLAPELDSAASNAEPGLFTSTSSDGVGSIEGDDKLEAMLDSTLAAEGVQLDPVPEGVNAPPTAIPDITTTSQGLAGEAAGGLEQGIPADTLGSLGTPAPPATLTAITPPAPQIKEDKTDASLGFDDAASSSSADAEETNKQLSETFGSSAADMPTKDLMVNLPASAPVESKKPQEAHQAAMGLTAKSKSSKPLAPGSHAAAPSNTASAAHPPSATFKSSPSTTGGLWGKAKNILGMGGGSRSAAEEEQLLEELAEEEEDADMMQSVIASKTGSGSPASSKSKKGGKQSQAEAAEMRERDELLREAEEEVDVGDREGFELGDSILAATETGRVLPASSTGKNGTSGKAAPPSTASSSGLFSSSPAKKGSNSQSQQEMEREVERFEEQEAELEAEMAEMRSPPSASKTGQKGDKAKAAAPASSSSAAGSGKAGSGGKLSSKSSSASKQDAEDLLLEEASEDYPYLEEDVEIRAADQKASAQQQAAKGVAPSTARKLPPAGGQYTPGGRDISKASPKGLKESLDELRDDLEEDVLEATDAGLPATGAGSALRQPAAPAIKGKTAAAPSSTASKLLGGRKTGEGSQELLEDGNTGMFGAASGSQGIGSKSATSKGTMAFEEDEEALGLAGGSTATPSKTGSSKLPEAFKEDVTGNDTFRSKASQGTLPGAAKQSGEASDTLAGKAGANSSAVKASMDKLADEAETGFEDFASGLGSSSSSSKSSKGLTGSTGSKATSSLSNADTMDEYDEESGFSGGGSKGAGGLSGQSSTKGSSSSPSPTTMAGAASKLVGASSSSSAKTSPAPGKSSTFGQKGGMSSQEESAFDSDADPLSSTGFGQKPTPGSSATSSKGSSALGSLGSYESSSKGSSAFGSNPDLLSSASGLGQKGGTASSGKSSSQLGADSETELDASSSMAVRDALKSAKDATLSGKGMTGFDGPESIAEMMDEQVKRTPGGSSIRDELAAPSKPSSQSTGQKINGLIFSPGSSTRNLILVSILGAVAGAAAIHYYRILRVSPAQKRIVDLRHFGQPRRGTSSYSRVSNPAAQTWDKDWNDDNWDDASERGFRQKPSR